MHSPVDPLLKLDRGRKMQISGRVGKRNNVSYAHYYNILCQFTTYFPPIRAKQLPINT